MIWFMKIQRPMFLFISLQDCFAILCDVIRVATFLFLFIYFFAIFIYLFFCNSVL